MLKTNYFRKKFIILFRIDFQILTLGHKKDSGAYSKTEK